MVKKQIVSMVLAAAMTVGLAAPFAVPALASTREPGRTPDIVQNNRTYINGDEINAYQDEAGTVYVPVYELQGYGFAVDDNFNVEWAGSGYEFDETYMPTTENGGMEKAAPVKSAVTVQVNGEEAALYTINGQECIEAEALESFGYGVYDAEKNICNIYVEAAGHTENENDYRDVVVDAGSVTGSFKKILGMHRDSNEYFVEVGVDSMRSHDIDGTSGDGRGIIYNLAPQFFDTIKAINLLEKLIEGGGEFKDPEDPSKSNLTAALMEQEYEKLKASGTLIDKSGNYELQIAAFVEKLEAIDLTSIEAYDFTELDAWVDKAIEMGADVYFRYGASQNDIMDNTFPPLDSEQWEPFAEDLSTIAQQIVKHYNQGWESDYTDVIKYFEIWNEPDLLDFWPNTLHSGPNAYYAMYDAVSSAVREVAPELPIGGPTLTTLNDDRGTEESFIKYVKENGCPLDFYAYHYYPSNNADPYDYARWANHLHRILEKYGYGEIPMFLSEYGTALFTNPFTMSANAENTFMTSALIYMQQSRLERAFSYGAMQGWTGGMSSTYYGYKALGNFKETSEILAVSGGDKNGYAVLAGTNEAKDKLNILISNYEIPAAQMLSNETDESHNPMVINNKLSIPGVANWSLPLARVMTYENNSGYNLTIKNLPFENLANVNVEVYRKNEENTFELVDMLKVPVKENTVEFSKDLLPYTYDLISVTPGEEFRTGWQFINGHWYFYNENSEIEFGWVNDGKAWYRTDPSTGKMLTGWVQVNGFWYYLSPSGAMLTGWQKIGGNWYYLKASGAMASNEWVGGYWLSANGAWTYKYIGSWKKNNVGWWFGDTSGWYAKNCTQVIDGVSYQFDAAGYWKK